MKRLLSVLIVAFVAVGCGPAKQISKAIKGPPRRTEFEQERFDRAVARGAVLVGMTKSEVRKARGDPRRKDYARKFGGIKVRRWVYSWDEVYFDEHGLVLGTYAAYR